MMGLAVHRCGIGPAAAAGGLPLDDYTTSMWSVVGARPLLQSYTGNILRVQRSSDSTELDIGQVNAGTASAALDESALTTFVGASNGSVVTLYDQSGNGRDATGRVGNYIVVSGTVQRMSGIACVYSSSSVVFTIASKPAALTSFTSLETTKHLCVLLKSSTQADRYVGVWQNGNGASITSNSGTAAAYIAGSSVGASRDTLQDAVSVGSPVVLAVTATSLATWGGNFQLGGYGSGFDYAGKLLDFAVYSDSALTDRADIETALGAAL